ncbi:MAG: hypothetical protein HYV07_05905 [Deltaproteobacteria bacterium]|nr:hypothetical protein [Deltaproteobacteria bacterium]
MRFQLETGVEVSGDQVPRTALRAAELVLEECADLLSTRASTQVDSPDAVRDRLAVHEVVELPVLRDTEVGVVMALPDPDEGPPVETTGLLPKHRNRSALRRAPAIEVQRTFPAAPKAAPRPATPRAIDPCQSGPGSAVLGEKSDFDDWFLPDPEPKESVGALGNRLLGLTFLGLVVGASLSFFVRVLG